ncbi:MAG: hypothetical protein Q7S29_02400 [Candidatus Peribacter sp.]|nr:hypothetical protein [Candidatus Peribacter sp.]
MSSVPGNPDGGDDELFPMDGDDSTPGEGAPEGDFELTPLDLDEGLELSPSQGEPVEEILGGTRGDVGGVVTGGVPAENSPIAGASNADAESPVEKADESIDNRALLFVMLQAFPADRQEFEISRLVAEGTFTMEQAQQAREHLRNVLTSMPSAVPDGAPELTAAPAPVPGEAPHAPVPSRWARAMKWIQNKFAWMSQEDRLSGEFLRGYRDLREKPEFVGLDEVGRPAAAGGLTLWGTTAAMGTDAAQIALLNNALPSYLPGISVAWPAAIPVLRRAHAWLAHGAKVDREFEASLGAGEGAQQRMKDCTGKIRQWQWTADKDLLDEPGEDTLVIALHNSERAKPSETPYLCSVERYAKYCFARLRQLCREAHEGLQVSPPRGVRGVTDEERQQLAGFHQQIEAGSTDALDHLLQVSVCYGRLLANHARDKREGQITGATFGTAAALSVATWSPLPLAIGAGAFGLRQLYRTVRKVPQRLEISAKGEIQGKGGEPILSAETAHVKGGDLYRPDVLMEYSEESQLTDSEKRWLPMIVIPAAVIDRRRYRTEQDLALAAAPHVQHTLGRRKALQKKVDEEEKTRLKEKAQKESQRLEALETELHQKQSQLEQLQDELALVEQQEKSIRKDESERAKARGPVLKVQIRRLQGAIEALAGLQPEQRTEIEDRLHAAEQKIGMPEDVNDPDTSEAGKRKLQSDIERSRRRLAERGQIERQRGIAEKAEQEYVGVRKPKEPDRPMGPEAVGQNMEIVRAFCVKVHQTFKKLKERKGEGWVKKAGGALGSAAAAPAKEIGKIALSGVAATTLAGGAAYGLTAYLAAQVPAVGAVVSPTTVGVLVGGVALAKFSYATVKRLLGIK